jgi:hypothetical protein
MIALLVNNKLQRTQKEVFVAYIASQHMPGRTEEYH